uniref:Putative metalloprotease n=1 Tax=Ixodes ricinus TaxID=34613 RepID=A0A0K8RD52_IXORI
MSACLMTLCAYYLLYYRYQMNGKELEANMYHDRSRMASVNIEEENGRYKVKGILSDNLRIEPLDINARSAAGPIPHKIIKIEQRARHIGNSTVDSKIKKNTNNFYAELKIVVDDYHRNVFKTTDDLVQYFALCITLVNIRFEDTSNPLVQFLLTTLEVAENKFENQSFWAWDVDCPFRNHKLYMDPVKMIEKAVELYGNNTEDITVVVTTLDLADNFDGTAYNHVMGQAKFEGLCSAEKRVAIVEDVPPTYSFIQIIAHELAHTLGATHDGDNSSKKIAEENKTQCYGESGCLMAPSAHGKNSGYFSNCSIEQISRFVRKLNSSCREVKLERYHSAKRTKLPGANMNLTEYCKTKHTNYPRISAIQEKQYMPLCKVLCCADGEWPCFDEPAVDGMSCGNGKICFRNKCDHHEKHLKNGQSFIMPSSGGNGNTGKQ